jgi:hypothetical protein
MCPGSFDLWRISAGLRFINACWWNPIHIWWRVCTSRVQLSTARRHRRAERLVHSLMRYVLVPHAGPSVTVDQHGGGSSENNEILVLVVSCRISVESGNMMSVTSGNYPCRQVFIFIRSYRAWMKLPCPGHSWPDPDWFFIVLHVYSTPFECSNLIYIQLIKRITKNGSGWATAFQFQDCHLFSPLHLKA